MSAPDASSLPFHSVSCTLLTCFQSGPLSKEIDEENIAALMDLAPVANGWGRNHSAQADRIISALENIPPSPRQKGGDKLSARDANAVNYSKSLMEEGDTLVIIRYPNNRKIYDATGFEIRDRHRVHSEKLLATGSTKFEKWLHDDWYQHRAKRRNGLINNMPAGVEYVLDLTPPEEGDEALELTAELSCPTGILLWRNSTVRCAVSKNLVGGKDETTIRSYNIQQTEPNVEDKGPSVIAQQVAGVKNGNGIGLSSQDSDSDDESPKPRDLDYDPIRHRTGIERLLQVIEGKDPRLDSAPKVWTLAVLAKHFECRSAVMDWVFTWIWADPNCRILETLPEACFRIVSEEALRIGTEHHLEEFLDLELKASGLLPGLTRFNRRKEFIDEDTLNIIQHAGRQFATRIDEVVANLLDPKMKWLHDLQEFMKLKWMTEHNLTLGDVDYDQCQRAVVDLEDELGHYVRGRILWCFIAQLEQQQLKRATSHRVMEGYKQAPSVGFQTVYDSLKEKERMLTRFFWEIVRDMNLGLHCTTNLIRDTLPRDQPFFEKQDKYADIHGVRKSNMYKLHHYTKVFNEQVLDAIKNENYNNGIYPPEAKGPSGQLNDWTPYSPSDHLPGTSWNANFVDEDTRDWSTEAMSTGVQLHDQTSASSTSMSDTLEVPRVPDDREIHNFSIFFSLSGFFRQANCHIRDITAQMLGRGENEWSNTCDTLLCLGDEEYKFLPLFAGGLDDGSGGVFEDVIPHAEKGPAGPGPSFHTGSTAGSHASSLAEWDGLSDVGTTIAGVDSSLGVEDGHSEDHIDRRIIKSESDFPLNLPIRGKSNVMEDDFMNVPEEDGDFELV
ncbi:hypothetical protein EG329_011033 [Mollisiaceae sp. DMI_Dod_QoI]|nr:hypothetical protein EG329_011033 [Helotiales sp. DMI_Dod_QoI]